MKIVKQKSNLIPYRIIGGCFEFFLSHRSKNAKQYPNYWSFWGGGIENNETPEDALLREIKEELDWNPDQYSFLGIYYDSMPNEKHIFITKVDNDFEKQIKILESQGGAFFTIENIKEEKMIIPEDKEILNKVFKTVSSSTPDT